MRKIANMLMSPMHVVISLIIWSLATAGSPEELNDFSQETKYLRRRMLGRYFNIKMYWTEGYRWQGRPYEKKFCMQCTLNNCPQGSGIKVERCDRSDLRQQFFFDSGSIRSKRNNDVCLERSGRSIKLESCNGSVHQLWDVLTKDGPFQLRIPGNEDKCASQHHHPKRGEKIYMTSCKKSVLNNTDKWVVY